MSYVIIYMYPEYMKQEEIMKDNFVPEAIIEKLRDMAKTRELPEAEKDRMDQETCGKVCLPQVWSCSAW